MIASSVWTSGASAVARPSRCAAPMWRAKCAATRGAAACAPPYLAVSTMHDHCRLQKMVDVLLQVDRGAKWLRMREPARLISVRDPADLLPAVREVEQLVQQHGFHAAGFVTYEAGRAFGMRTCTPNPDMPLAWFALFDTSHVVEQEAPAAAASYDVT